jgi:hypothetical protein
MLVAWSGPLLLVAASAGCSPRAPVTEGDASGTGSTTADATTSNGASESTASSGSDSSGGSTEDPGIDCPAPESSGNTYYAGIRFDPALPDSSVDAVCDGLGMGSVDDGLGVSELRLSCLSPDFNGALELQLVLGTDAFDDRLQAWSQLQALALSFRREGPALKNLGPSANSRTLTLRDADDELLLMSVRGGIQGAHYTPPPTEVQLYGPYWLQDPAERAAWNDPFGPLSTRNVGCARREGTRRPTWTGIPLLSETPWTVVFTSDAGEEQLFDQSSSTVLMDGTAFEVHVNHAYVSDETGSTNLSSLSEVEFLVLRSSAA